MKMVQRKFIKKLSIENLLFSQLVIKIIIIIRRGSTGMTNILYFYLRKHMTYTRNQNILRLFSTI